MKRTGKDAGATGYVNVRSPEGRRLNPAIADRSTAPGGALIFRFEQVVIQPAIDYGKVYQLLNQVVAVTPDPFHIPTLPAVMAVARGKLKRRAYLELRAKAGSLADEIEKDALASTSLLPGVKAALEGIRPSGWMVALVSDLGKSSVSGFVDREGFKQSVDEIAGRVRIDDSEALEDRLKPLKSELKTLEGSIYFCSALSEIKEAKALGMRCFALPSRGVPVRATLAALPTGLILSLEELPELLALPSMKPPSRPELGGKD